VILVVDANIIFSCLIKSGFTLEILKLTKNKGYKLVTPEYVLEEIERRKDKILEYSGLSEEKVNFLLSIIFSEIEVVPVNEYREFLEEAKLNAPVEDFPYLALALKYKKDGKNVRIWSNDLEFREKSGKTNFFYFYS